MFVFLTRADVVFAGECTTIDLRSAHLGENRSQQASNWCYAMVAADLAADYLKKPVSEIDIGMTFTEKKNKITYSRHFGGHPGQAFEFAAEKGFCDASRTLRLQKEFATLRHQLIALEGSFRKREDGSISSPCPLLNTFPEIDVPTLFAIMRAPDLTTFARMRKTRDAACKERMQVPKNIGVVGDRYSQAGLDKILESGRVPAVTYYIQEVMKFKGYHISSVVGRRKNPESGVCEYLVRNSFGDSCENYRPEFASRCEQGNFWISEGEAGRIFKELLSVKEKVKGPDSEE